MAVVTASRRETCATLSFLLAILTSPCIVRAGAGEWFHECKGESCGYGGHHRTANDDCQDTDPSECPGYTRQGECFANPEWMLINCKQSCGICDDERRQRSMAFPDDEDCTDKHNQCSKWAKQMECFANPSYMSQACPASCWLCVNATDLRQKGVSESKIERRRKFSQTDFGLWQSIPNGANGDVVRDRLRRMNAYARKLNNTGPGTVCNNQHHDCSLWATENDACRTNLKFMLPQCSLACQYCDVIETYHKCRATTQDRAHNSFRDIASVYKHLSVSKRAIDLVHGTGSCSQDHSDRSNQSVCQVDNDDFQDEWVLSVDRNVLWKEDDPSIYSVESLVKLLKSKEEEWIDVLPDEYDRSGQLLTVRWDAEPVVESFVTELADLLNAPKSHIELDFVRYSRGQRFESHKDARLHDLWKFSGARVLSVYIILETATKGGNFGFPKLDWLMVESPQILVWPNIKSLEPENTLEVMTSEQLPVVEGQLYAAQIWVHEYPYDGTNPCA